MSEAFEQLFERYHQRVYSFFIRRGFTPDEAKDLAQETWVRVLEHMDTYRGGELGFVMSITNSIWKNSLRHWAALKRERPATLDDPEDSLAERVQRPLYGPPPRSPEQAALWRERVAGFRCGIRALPARMRRAVTLRILGFSYLEIAAVQRTTIDVVRKLLRDARKRLREAEPSAADALDRLAPRDND